MTGSLLREAGKQAARDKLTLRELIELGLHRMLLEGKRRKKFRLRDRSVKGEGLQPEFQGASWQKIRGTSTKAGRMIATSTASRD